MIVVWLLFFCACFAPSRSSPCWLHYSPLPNPFSHAEGGCLFGSYQLLPIRNSSSYQYSIRSPTLQWLWLYANSLVWDQWLIKSRLSGLLLRTTSYLNSCAAVTISANHRPLHNCCYANKTLLGSTCILFSHCTIEFHWRNFPYSKQFLLLICIRCTWNMMNMHVSGVTLWV